MTQALVLAGGGVTGIAWETGVLLGLRDEGFDCVSGVDLVVGTSAGSTVGAQILSGHDLAELHELQLSDQHGEINPRIDLELLAEIFGMMPDGGTTTDFQRAEIGRLALTAETVDEPTRRRVIESRLLSHEWPATSMILTAINAVTGEFVTWDKDSGVSIIDAVASSCAVPSVWPCVTIGDDRYYDGGLRNSANAFLAAGHDLVTVIAPLTTGLSPIVKAELDALSAAGATVRLIRCDADAIDAMGPNSLDPRFRRVAAEHGRRQGRTAII
jgi:NTE family protein